MAGRANLYRFTQFQYQNLIFKICQQIPPYKETSPFPGWFHFILCINYFPNRCFLRHRLQHIHMPYPSHDIPIIGIFGNYFGIIFQPHLWIACTTSPGTFPGFAWRKYLQFCIRLPGTAIQKIQDLQMPTADSFEKLPCDKKLVLPTNP